MVQVSDEEFQALVDEALASLPGEHAKRLENVAILYERDPSSELRARQHLGPNQTLLGLYEGVPLSQRQGTTRILPDKITLFINPLCSTTSTLAELKEQIRHTLWHEIAHYYGLNHTRIQELE